jgi:hypothetical protein
LLGDVHAYLEAKPSFVAQAVAEGDAVRERADAVNDRVERNRLVREHNALKGIVAEYQRRKMLTGRDAAHLAWQFYSPYHVVRAADKLEALARRL